MTKAFPRTPCKLTLAISSAVLAMGLSGNLQAQNMALEEIIVTAQKRMETSQETPLSITAFSEDSIEKRGILNSADLIGQVAAVSGFTAPGSRGATSLNMRGVAAGSPANISLDPAVGLYMDGVYIGKLAGSSMDVAEIARIEVLRGPQGTLYGRNSTGGAVNFITQKPTGEFGFRATATAGDYDLWGVKINMDTPSIGEVGEGLGQFAATIGYQKRDRGALYDNYSGGADFDTIDRQAWRVAVNWTPVDVLTIDYVYDHSELDEVGALQQVVGTSVTDAAGTNRIDFLRNQILPGAQYAAFLNPGDSRITDRLIPSLQQTIASYEAATARGEGRASGGGADFAPIAKNDLDGHSLTVDWEAGELGFLGDVSFKSITGYRELDSFVFGDLEDIDSSMINGVGAVNDPTLAALVGLYTAPGNVLPFLTPATAGPYIDNVWAAMDDIGGYHSKQDTDTRYEQFSQEFQMLGSTDRTDYAIGLYWFEDESEYRRRAIFSAPLTGKETQNYDLSTEAWAIFGQGTWTPAIMEDRLSLTLGMRYTEETKEIHQNYGGVVSPLTPDLTTFPALTVLPYPSVGSDQIVDNEENFYNVSGTFTAAYQFSDDLNGFVRYATGYRSGGFNGEQLDNAFTEETIEQLEVGLKSDWWDRRLRINGSLYTYEYEDMQASQLQTINGRTTSKITNAGKADRWGGELEVTVAPMEDMVLALTYAYIKGHFEEFPETAGQYSADKAKRTSPGNQFGFNADYTFARTNYGDWNAYVQVNWQDTWAESVLWTRVDSSGNAVFDPHQQMDERTIVNARLNLQNVQVGDGLLRVTLWGKNLTDDDYPTFGVNFGGLGILTEQYGDPRTYGMDVSYEF